MSNDPGGGSLSCRRPSSLLLLALLSSALGVSAAAGDLDPTFGVNGVASFDLKIGDFSICAAAPTDDGTSVLALHTASGVEIWSVDEGGTTATDRSLSFAVSASLDCSLGIRDLVCPAGDTVCYGAGRISDGDEDSWLIAFDWTTWTLVNGIVSGGNQTIDSAPKATDGFDALATWAAPAPLAGESSLGSVADEVLPVGREVAYGSLVIKSSGSTTWKTVQIDTQTTEYRRIFVEGDCAWAQGVTLGDPPKLFVCKYCRDSKSGEWSVDTSFGVGGCWKEDLDGREVMDFKVLGGRPMLLYTTVPFPNRKKLFFRQVGVDGGVGYPAKELFDGLSVPYAEFTRCSDPSELPKVEISWGYQDNDAHWGVSTAVAIFLDGEPPRHLSPRSIASDEFDLGSTIVEFLEDWWPRLSPPAGSTAPWDSISLAGPAADPPRTVGATRSAAAADANLVLFRLEAPDLLFYDGFETEDLSAWSANVP